MQHTEEILLEFQPYIMASPVTPQDAHNQACQADANTITHWRETWLRNIKDNKATYGSFAENSVGQVWDTAKGRPAIIAGAGPSLKKTIERLKDRPKDMLLISCLHNFHYMEANNANVDYYVSLDAGPLTIKEITEGSGKTEEECFAMSKNKTLIAYVGTQPELLRKWQGKVLFFSAPIPDPELNKEIQKIEPFRVFVESGGSVFGTSMFFAKGFLGCTTTIFVGADFSFSSAAKTQFHPWESDYDKNLGNYINAVDIFGNRKKTWLSYYNFKLWTEVVAQRVPGIYINASEGGILGAHRDGNIIHIKQMWLDQVYDMFDLHQHKKEQALTPELDNKKVLI